MKKANTGGGHSIRDVRYASGGLYVLCRHIGWKLAYEKVMSLVESGYLKLET
ncbi:MAG: hypothetical protein KIH01_08780 [Candidatus Freyarchaeota archaeon]|nr:hypothetical protein [Candidatus Jordarchaeia archaeon]